MEAQGTVQVSVKIFRGGVTHPPQVQVRQTDHLGLLGHHVHGNVCGQAFLGVDEPFKEVAIFQGGHTNRSALVVDLGVVICHLKLADHVRQLAQLAVAQTASRRFIQHGNFVVGHLLDLGGSRTVNQFQKITIGAGAENGNRNDLAHHEDRGQDQHKDDHHFTLVLGKGEVIPQMNALAAGIHTQSNHKYQDVDQQEHQNKAVKPGVMQVDGG